MDEDTSGTAAGDTGATKALPPDDAEATRVMPGDDAGATRVMGAGDTGETRVMAGGAGGSPPPPVQPTLLMTNPRRPSGGGGGGGFPWWGWLLVVLAILAAGAAVWFFVLKPSPAPGGQDFIGTWSPESGGGGGLVIAASGDRFKVTEYDDQLKKAGVQTADLVNGELQMTLSASALGISGASGTVTATLTHDAATDRLTLQVTSGSLKSRQVVFVRSEVLLPGSPSPTPTPTLTPTPTASPSVSPSVSPSGSPSPSSTADQQVIDGIAAIQVGIVAWANAHNNLYPAPQDVVSGGGISQYVTPWPVSPYTNQPMLPGTSPGDYVYEQIGGGSGYKLTGYLANGLTYSVP